MKNLKTFVRSSFNLKRGIIEYCINYDDGVVYSLTDSLDIIKYHLYTKQDQEFLVELTAKLHSSFGKPLKEEDVILFEFVVEARSILLATKCGRLALLSLCEPFEVNFLLDHKTQLSSVCLSPSQDLIALADFDHNVLIMSCFDCHVLNTANALKDNESLHKPVGLGWGSKETQFFGLDGRPSHESSKGEQQQQLTEQINEGIIKKIECSSGFKDLKHQLDRPTTLDWRGDGQLLASLTFIKDTGKHYLKVWNRNLELQYMSEQLVSFENGLLTWVPDGRSVCLGQRRDHSINEVVFFEKNGLVRQRLTLPVHMPHMYIKSINWSPNCNILGIIVRQFSVEDEVKSRDILMLYTMQNWHYYLKYSEQLPPGNSNHVLKWDTANPNRLHVMSSNGSLKTYDCNPIVDSSRMQSTVIVVDANKVLITPLETCIVPPPMAAITLKLPSLIQKVAILQKEEPKLFILTLDNKLICSSLAQAADDFITNDEGELSVELSVTSASRMARSIQDSYIFDLNVARSFQHLVALNSHNLLASEFNGTGSSLVLLTIGEDHKNILHNLIKTFDSHIISISCYQNEGPIGALVLLDDGNSLLYNHPTMTLVEGPKLMQQLTDDASSCDIIEAQPIISSQTNERIGIVSLTKNYTLRYNNKIIASNCCTSFKVTENYLVYTTSDNNMHFIPIHRLVDINQPGDIDSLVQGIEAGGTLIAVLESKSQAILQMPRGNLEIIHPRVLLFSTITKLLGQGDCVKPCQLARRHRINTNFLIDYIYSSASGQVDAIVDFARAVAKHDTSLLSLIISELDDSNTLVDRYSSILKFLPSSIANVKPFDYETLETTKVNFMCKYLSCLSEEDKFIHLVIQCLLKMNPKQTEKALRKIQGLNQDKRDAALKFMLYFVDIDQLFNEALGTYDLDLALMVAQISNKDPKAYLKLLKSLHEIQDEFTYCYQIDMKIKRYESAMENLFSGLSETYEGVSDSSEIIDLLGDLISSKRLYKKAVTYLECGRVDLEMAQFAESIWIEYAKYLLEKRHYVEAGMMASKAYRDLAYNESETYFNEAIKCYLLANDWQKCLLLIDRSEYLSSKTKADTIERLKRHLTLAGNTTDALLLSLYSLRENLESTESGPSCVVIEDLISSQNWCLAEVLAPKTDKETIKWRVHQKLLEPSSNCGIVKLLETLKEELKLAKDRFKRLCELLLVPRSRAGIMGDSYASDGSSIADSSEVSSLSSRDNPNKPARSGATSIKTKKLAKLAKPTGKRITTKPGSRYEDLALIKELQAFIGKQRENYKTATEMTGNLFLFCSVEDTINWNDQLREVLNSSLTLSRSICDALWPRSDFMDQKYALYQRYGGQLVEARDNLDFEILIRPDVPSSIDCLEF